MRICEICGKKWVTVFKRIIFAIMPKKLILIAFSFLMFAKVFFGQSDSLQPTNPPNYKTRKLILASSSTALTLGSLFYLNHAWYNQYNTGSFHFFNDNAEWLQMDKAGHVYTTYQMSRLMMGAFNWAGYNKQKELFIGGTIGFAYMTAIECMDGFSKGWGFSFGDEIGNVFGTTLAISQQALWKQQRIQLKYSYSQSGLSKYNGSLLGNNFGTQILKDYNAQTYWLSINPSAFMKQENKFPKWLNVAIGYSAYGMLGGTENNFVVQDEDGSVLKFERERRYYFSLDIDLTQIKTKSKILKKAFSIINILKFPAPAIQFTKNKPRFYYLYY